MPETPHVEMINLDRRPLMPPLSTTHCSDAAPTVH